MFGLWKVLQNKKRYNFIYGHTVKSLKNTKIISCIKTIFYEEYEKYNIYLKKPRRIRINKTKYTHMIFDDIYTNGGLWDKK
jgi:hypothetical protein